MWLISAISYTCNPVHDDDQALTINTISLPGGPRPRVDFFTTERSPNRDLGISKTRFHINIMSRWAKSLTRMLKNELSVLECVTKLGKQSESLMLATYLTHHPGASLPLTCHPTLCDSFTHLMLKESDPWSIFKIIITTALGHCSNNSALLTIHLAVRSSSKELPQVEPPMILQFLQVFAVSAPDSTSFLAPYLRFLWRNMFLPLVCFASAPVANFLLGPSIQHRPLAGEGRLPPRGSTRAKNTKASTLGCSWDLLQGGGEKRSEARNCHHHKVP